MTVAKQKDHSEATAVGEGRTGPLINVVTGGMERRGWDQDIF